MGITNFSGWEDGDRQQSTVLIYPPIRLQSSWRWSELTGFYQKTKILLVLLSHELLSTKYIIHQSTYFIYYSHQVQKFNIKKSNKYIKVINKT